MSDIDPSTAGSRCPFSVDNVPKARVNPCEASHHKPNRFRLSEIDRAGIAQLSIIETALWPLDPKTVEGVTYHTEFKYTEDKRRKRSEVTVRAALGLQPNDDYILWGLLALTLTNRDAEPLLRTTPYWCLKQLGMPTGGSYYIQFRDAIERLAHVTYHSTAFYHPIAQTHRRMTFNFFTLDLPVEIDCPSSWGIRWTSPFFEMTKAAGGRLLFDLDLFRKLSPAARRLFLKLQDRFYRSDRVLMNVDDLTIHGMGFSAARPLYKRKYDLTRCMKELLDQGIIALGRGQNEAKQLFMKRGKGCYIATFYKGPYFKAPASSEGTPRRARILTDEPLYQPLKAIGFDDEAIRRIFHRFPLARIQQWVKITELAIHEKPKGFPGFKKSPAAFCYNGMQRDHMPPDWVYEHEKHQRRQQWERERRQADADERDLRNAYEAARNAALRVFVEGEGQDALMEAHRRYTKLYAGVYGSEGERRQAAMDDAIQKVERDEFEFPDFGVWAMEQQVDVN